MDRTQAGSARAAGMQTRLQAKAVKENEAKRESMKNGLSRAEYWAKHVRSPDDIIQFYSLYHPEFPEFLAKSIATRVGEIVEKSRRGEQLTHEDKQYYIRSQQPASTWDPTEDLKKQEMAAKIQMAMDKMDELSVSK